MIALRQQINAWWHDLPKGLTLNTRVIYVVSGVLFWMEIITLLLCTKHTIFTAGEKRILPSMSVSMMGCHLPKPDSNRTCQISIVIAVIRYSTTPTPLNVPTIILTRATKMPTPRAIRTTQADDHAVGKE